MEGKMKNSVTSMEKWMEPDGCGSQLSLPLIATEEICG